MNEPLSTARSSGVFALKVAVHLVGHGLDVLHYVGFVE